MTAVADHPIASDPHGDAHDGEHDHPANAFYWKVGVILAVLTAVETSTFWWKDWFDIADAGRVTGPVLIIMMSIKFFMICAFFMHLRFDSKLLRQVFIAGLILAGAVYAAGLSAMNWWYDSGNERYNDAPRERPMPPPPTEKPAVATGGGAH